MSQNTPQRKRTTLPCPNCGKLVSVNAEKCLHCGHASPGRFFEYPMLHTFLTGRTRYAESIVLVIFVLYALSIAMGFGSEQSGGMLGMLTPRGIDLYRLGAGGLLPLQDGRWWSLLTGTYLHGGILHILFNMMWLRDIGPFTEELYGNSRFLIIYTLSGLGGAVLTTIMGTSLFVGASGAIFGLFGALLFYGWQRGGVFGNNILRRMGIWAAIGLVYGLIVPGIDNWGHLGGIVFGFALAAVLKYSELKKETYRMHYAAVGILGFILLCFGFMVVNFFIR